MHASMSRSQPGGGSSQPGQPQHGLQQPHQQGQHHGQQQRLQNNQQQRNMSLPHMQQQQQKSSRSSQQQHRHSSGRNSYYFRFISQISVSGVFPTSRIFSWKYSGTFVELQQHRHSSRRNSYNYQNVMNWAIFSYVTFYFWNSGVSLLIIATIGFSRPQTSDFQ